MLVTSTTSSDKKDPVQSDKRLSLQRLLPQKVQKEVQTTGDYQLFPSHPLGTGKIFNGYESLAVWILRHPTVIIDGYSGVLWQDVRTFLSEVFYFKGVRVNWLDMTSFLKTPEEIAAIVDPYLGSSDSLWGKKCDYDINNFFNHASLEAIQPDDLYDLNILFGSGAALVRWPDTPVIYLDLPKNELQYRMRAGSITNLGCRYPTRPSEMYKRFYFVDWVVLNKHKKDLMSRVSVFADVQWMDSVNWMLNESLSEGLQAMSRSVFRVRPWFEAGAWGGHWMKDRFEGLSKDEVNYAWSFELIVPENGIIFESDGYLLELSFDYLMFADNRAILGKHAGFFGDEFPIRFDFLDTWDGGNLSIQCHPSLQYIRRHFGEQITQDETYYILDCKEDATVYLGFQENIDADKFREVLENSRNNNVIVAIEEYVLAHQAHKHDLFLIPNGTVHSAGANNLVLEISATPYIFTFKMYDWLRLDLNGEPRAINIEHAFNNLKFERKGNRVKSELISTPSIIEKGEDWELVHLPTHDEHLYDVNRIEFNSTVNLRTKGSCHVLMLVEGTTITVKTPDGRDTIFHYAETFVVPAAAEYYQVTNLGNNKAKLIIAFIKDNLDFLK
ncbi:class I mannose-6-phosphate isomerase [Flavitalea sp.]|nr:class I mannose-6-phosphate isomerase [Flavitalea sp.]